jgi:hypothetical protein
VFNVPEGTQQEELEMTDTPTPRIAEQAAHAIAAWVADEMVAVVETAQQKNAALAADLKIALALHAGAEEEIARLRRELNGRPTTAELEAAQRRASELSARIDELTTELEARPSSPDQILDLVRQELAPVFGELRRVVEAMEPKTTSAPKSPEPAAPTAETPEVIEDAEFEEVEKGGETKPEAA